MKLPVCFFLFLFILKYSGQNSSSVVLTKKNSKVKDSVLSILKHASRVEGEYIGITHCKSRIYEAATIFWNLGSIKQLSKFTSDKNPVVRCYAFLGLINNKEDKLKVKSIAARHKKDLEMVSLKNACIGMRFTVADFMRMESSAYDLDPVLKRSLDSLYISGK